MNWKPPKLPEWLTITRDGDMLIVDVEGMATAHVGALTSCDPADLALYAIAEWLSSPPPTEDKTP